MASARIKQMKLLCLQKQGNIFKNYQKYSGFLLVMWLIGATIGLIYIIIKFVTGLNAIL